MVLPIVRWWLVLVGLGFVGLPWALWLFRRLPDHGIAFAKALGLLLVGYGAWLLTSIGMGGFDTALIGIVALAVAGTGVWACHRSRIGIRTTLRSNRAWWLWCEGLFAGAMLLGLVLRWHAPSGAGIGHTETPMDFTFLNGILASQGFPPQDPWLAGYPINYYYFGYLLVALMTRLSGLSSAMTFMLALPTIFALTAVGVAGTVWNATGLWKDEGGRRKDEQAEPSSASSPIPHPSSFSSRLVCATLAAVLVLLMGNQMAALMYVTGTQQVVSLDASEQFSAIRQSLAGKPEITFTQPTPPMDPQEWGNATQFARKPGKQLGDFFWWPSRAVWDTTTDSSGQVNRRYAITEFPLFSFILGDMHPHVLSLPWTLLAIALALNLVTRRAAPEFVRTKGGRVELLLTGIILGSLYAINSWDLPTYLLLYLLTLGVLYAWLAAAPRKIFWPHLVMQSGAVIGAAYVLWLPFYLSFTSLVGGKGFPLGLAPARTGLHAFVLIFGLFFVPLLAMLVQSTRGALHVRRTAPQEQRREQVPTFGIVARPSLPTMGLSWPIATAVALVAGLLLRWPLLWLLPLALWAIVAAYQTPERPRTVALLLFAVGAMVVWGTDVVYLHDVFNSRMNTVFKFFYQVWLLWGTAAGISLWLLARRFRLASVLWTLPFAVLFMGASFYFLLAPNWKSGEPTLNGLAQAERDRPAESKAIAWIRANTPTTAVILEAPGGGYNSYYGMVSMTTGRQTVVGWKGHEEQWRGGQRDVYAQLGMREQDATTIFTSLDQEEAQPLLDKYKVDYVFVGTNERELVYNKAAPPAALTKFDEFMDKVYDADGVVIYKRR